MFIYSTRSVLYCTHIAHLPYSSIIILGIYSFLHIIAIFLLGTIRLFAIRVLFARPSAFYLHIRHHTCWIFCYTCTSAYVNTCFCRACCTVYYTCIAPTPLDLYIYVSAVPFLLWRFSEVTCRYAHILIDTCTCIFRSNIFLVRLTTLRPHHAFSFLLSVLALY